MQCRVQTQGGYKENGQSEKASVVKECKEIPPHVNGLHSSQIALLIIMYLWYLRQRFRLCSYFRLCS